MRLIENLLNQPFPGCNLSLRNFRSPLIAGCIVFFIIYFLKPFGFDQVPAKYIFIHSVFYGAITFITIAANLNLLPLLFSKWFEESRWTLGKEFLLMMWQILTISIANVLLTHILYGWSLSFLNILLFIWYTFVVGVFPMSFLLMLKYISLLKKHQQTANSIEPDLVTPDSGYSDNTRVTLLGDYQNEVLEVRVDDILYISAADNYIQVFYLQNDKLASSFLRSTLKKAEESLNLFPQFFRCHRTYLVNLNKINHINGNAQGLKLHIEGSPELIPVSRSLNQELKQLIQAKKQLPVYP